MPITGWRNLALLISIAGLTGGCAPVWVDAGEHANPRRGALQSPAPACEHQDLPCPALVELGFTYPFAREPDSYLFLDGVVYPYAEVTDDLLGDSRVLLPDGSTITVHRLLRAFGLEAEAFEPQTPVIGYGSNASPAQLTRKFIVEDFAGIPVIPVMKGTIEDYDVVFAPHFVSYGAMPATMVPMPGTDAEIWVNWLDDAELAQMNESEGAGGLYAFGDLSAEWDDAGPDPDTMKVYVDCFGGLEIDGQLLALSAVPATGRTARAVRPGGPRRGPSHPRLATVALRTPAHQRGLRACARPVHRSDRSAGRAIPRSKLRARDPLLPLIRLPSVPFLGAFSVGIARKRARLLRITAPWSKARMICGAFV
jgi:hypothetical protein